MSVGWSVGNITAISEFAVKVITAYEGAPDDYKHIAEEVKSLQIMIHKVIQNSEGSMLVDNDGQESEEVLKGCRSVLRDFIQKYNTLTSTNASQVLLGIEDIPTLRARLATSTTLLSSFIRGCEYLEIQTRLTDILGLQHTSSRVSIDSATNTKKALKMFCKNLYQTGVTAEVISQKEKEILNIFNPQNTVMSGQIDDSNIDNDSTMPTVNLSRSRFDWVQPMDFLGPFMLSAAETGDTKGLISMLEYVQNIDWKDNRGETALHKAANYGHINTAQLLLGKGASIRVRSKNYNTPLHRAAFHGHTSIVGLLLKKGASIDALTQSKNTPLHQAASNGHTSTVELLLEKGASIETINKHNYTPLHFAALRGHTSTIELLLRKGASIEVLTESNETPLHLAVLLGHTSTVELILRRDASIEVINDQGNTPLHLAAESGHTSIVELLLRKDSSTAEVINNEGSTPLGLASEYGHTRTVELLLEKAPRLKLLVTRVGGDENSYGESV